MVNYDILCTYETLFDLTNFFYPLLFPFPIPTDLLLLLK